MGGSEASLDGIAILAALGASDREALARRCRWRRFGEDEVIIDREQDSREVYLVVSGVVRVVDYSLQGREISFAEIGAGGCFGELAALDGQPRSAHVVAIEETRTASLPATAFVDILRSHPAAALALLQYLASVIRQSTGRIMDLSTMGAHNRIYAELLREAKPAGGNRAAWSPLPVHADLAARVSTTRETVARALGDLARKGIVARDGDSLVVNDVARLKAMVQHFRSE